MSCFAYNRDGLRCDSVAGHDGPHTLTIEWTDEECWVPGETIEVTLKEYGVPRITTPLTEHLVEVPKSSGKCVICSHRMHNGACTAMDGEFDCDCANGVEE